MLPPLRARRSCDVASLATRIFAWRTRNSYVPEHMVDRAGCMSGQPWLLNELYPLDAKEAA